MDEGTRFIFFVFGKQDLKTKLLKILNYDDAHMRHIDLSSADFTVDNASYLYGKVFILVPSHYFNVVIPKLSIQSPQTMKNFSMVKAFPGGIGTSDMTIHRCQQWKFPIPEYGSNATGAAIFF